MRTLALPEDRIRTFCSKQPIRKLSLFGSALTAKFGPQSDVDLLVEFEPNASVGFLEMAAMENELTDMVGRKVDLRTPMELSRYFRQEVVDTAKPIYVKK